LARQQQDYLRTLREKGDVAVYLEEPVCEIADLSTSNGFFRRASRALVTIVELADFQCPFRKAVLPTIDELMSQYRCKVRWKLSR
jgi:protein-disulfide isomerase